MIQGRGQYCFRPFSFYDAIVVICPDSFFWGTALALEKSQVSLYH